MKIKNEKLTKKEERAKQEEEDLKDILRSEDEGFGVISEGYRHS